MAKKKQEEVVEPRLKPETYWKWRCTINEMDVAKKELDVNSLKYEMMIKDLEIARLKISIFKGSLTTYQEKVSLTKSEYELMKKEIEAEIGMSLNGCSIDDIEFKVIKLEDPVNGVKS